MGPKPHAVDLESIGFTVVDPKEACAQAGFSLIRENLFAFLHSSCTERVVSSLKACASQQWPCDHPTSALIKRGGLSPKVCLCRSSRPGASLFTLVARADISPGEPVSVCTGRYRLKSEYDEEVPSQDDLRHLLCQPLKVKGYRGPPLVLDEMEYANEAR